MQLKKNNFRREQSESFILSLQLECDGCCRLYQCFVNEIGYTYRIDFWKNIQNKWIIRHGFLLFFSFVLFPFFVMQT